ncbi:calcium uniporter protein 4, mitochondrial-like [Actinidia eriantha]|uniref:calcium uniporter protein 4, mitochondrial-like n=1 Tax=Actinidia eriantha TaxID=165200 RepID=UPI00258BBB79|nr:calcium uniporter protein 4, mitochondrial-like [Actinidia eriantha]
MALRRTLAKRLFTKNIVSSPIATLDHSPISSPKTAIPPNAAKTNFHRELLTSPDSADSGFFRRFLQSRAINQAAKLPEFLSIPVGDRLREKLKSMNVPGNRLHLDGLSPPVPSSRESSDSIDGITVHEARKIMRSAQLQKVRSALREIPANSISYSDYVETCVDVCSNRDQGVEVAKKLDESGNVIVLGNVVFLRPEQVAKSMEKIITTSIATPNDPRRKELDHMEHQKAQIDRKAQHLVQAELYCGLGYIVLQALGLMRLTFWELSWDVMEPICFFLTSFHFALAYAFFLRTWKEPSFEGYSQRRFKAKQKKLMEIHNFDVEKYNQLCRAFYANHCEFTNSGNFSASGCRT